MALALGKRKRRATPKEEVESSDSEDMRAAFQRAFEKKFAPLEGIRNKDKAIDTEVEDLRSESEHESEWSGLDSEDDAEEETNQVQVVTYNDDALRRREDEDAKREAKAFMNSKPPTLDRSASGSRPSRKDLGEEKAEGEALNLKNDLALQRLISESHLLNPAAEKASNHRQRIADIRMQSLGAKGSLLEQEKMPISHRKGIVAKRRDKEASRRQEAKENGIILEKAQREKKKPSDSRRRERGVGGPSVGKFSGGTLRLGKGDIRAIKGR